MSTINSNIFPAFLKACIFILCTASILVDSKASNQGFAGGWSRALKMTLYEQELEDVNAVHRIDNHLVRRLIVMPLTEAFNPYSASAMHGKVQYGDKCSLPSSLGRLIFEKPYEVPWLFEITPVRNESQYISYQSSDIQESEQVEATNSTTLNKAYCSPLDFRAPENYIFMPRWLMKTLGVKPLDAVDISFVRIKLAGLVVLQPLTLAWEKLMETCANPKSLLEHEINKYSSLTAGSTILIEVNGVEYPLYVKETRGEGGVSLLGVRVQDSDINVDINRSVLDDLKKQQQLKEEEEEKQRKLAAEQKKLEQQKIGGKATADDRDKKKAGDKSAKSKR